MIELFNVKSTVRQYLRCKDVLIHWLVVHRKMPVAPYVEVIKDYAQRGTGKNTFDDKWYAEECVDELFTGDEARALIDYLDLHHIDLTHVVSPAKLPIERGVAGLMLRPLDGDFLIPEKDTWNLRFLVWGYFDLQRHEPALGGKLAPLQERRRAFPSGRFFSFSKAMTSSCRGDRPILFEARNH